MSSSPITKNREVCKIEFVKHTAKTTRCNLYVRDEKNERVLTDILEFDVKATLRFKADLFNYAFRNVIRDCNKGEGFLVIGWKEGDMHTISPENQEGLIADCLIVLGKEDPLFSLIPFMQPDF
jgi:hypothetical protein